MGESGPRLVTVVIAVHNAERYIHRAIRSVLEQDCPHWSLLILDDGSTDETPALARDCSNGLAEVIRFEENRGKARVMNDALDLCKTPYLLELDADDWLAPLAIRVIVGAFSASPKEAALVTSDHRLWMERGDGELRARGQVRGDRVILGRAQGRPPIPRAYRTEAVRSVGGWPATGFAEGRLFEDVALCARLLSAHVWGYAPVIAYHRLVRERSVSQTHRDEYRSFAQELFANCPEYDASPGFVFTLGQ